MHKHTSENIIKNTSGVGFPFLILHSIISLLPDSTTFVRSFDSPCISGGTKTKNQ